MIGRTSTYLLLVSACVSYALPSEKPNKHFFGGGSYGGQQFAGTGGLSNLASAFGSLTGGLNGLGGNGIGAIGGGLNGFGGGLGVGGGLGAGGGYGIGGGLGGAGGLGGVVGLGVVGGLGGVASSGSCRYWCRTPQGQSYCCESGQDLPSLPSVKPGQCPPVRPQCPPTRAGFRPPTQCSNDSRCPGAEKCCFDTCLQHHTCKLPTSYYG